MSDDKTSPFFITEEHTQLTTPLTPSSMLAERLKPSVENWRAHFSLLCRQLRTQATLNLGLQGSALSLLDMGKIFKVYL